MANRQICWGPNLENVLNLGELYNLTTDRETREGSDFVQGGSGVEDSWVTGYDYTLAWEARFIPDKPGGSVSPVSGQTAWQGFLDWARRKNPFRFVPDDTAPLFYADNCYLMDPAKGFGAPGGDLKRVTPVKIRNAAQDFHAMLRGIMFEYAPGADITPLGLGGTFADAGVSGFLNNAGLFESAAINTLKDRHYPKGYSGGLPVLPRTTLLQAAATNKLTFPEDISNAVWQKADATVPSTNNPSPRNGDLTASFVREGTGVATQHWVAQSYTRAAATNTAGVSIFLKANGRTKALWLIAGANENDRYQVNIDLGAGTVVTGTVGTGSITFATIVPLLNGWFMVTMYGVPATNSTNTIYRLYLADGTGSTTYTGDGASGMYVWGCVGTDNQIAGMYWGTGASRASEVFTFPHSFPFQSMWMYVKLLEIGTAYVTAAPVRVLNVGGEAGPNRLEFYYYVANGGYTAGLVNDAQTFQESAVTGNTPVLGNTVELFVPVTVTATGVFQLHQSINGAASVLGPQRTLSPAPTKFNAPIIRLNDFGAGVQTGHLALQQVKLGPLTFGGQTIDTIAKARAA